MTEHFQTGLKKPGRGMARASRDMIDAMYTIADIAYSRTSALYREAKEKFGDDDTRETRLMHRDYIEGILGMDGDEYTDGPALALYEAYDDFTLTEPTTLAGLFAMLIYCGEIVEREPDVLELVDWAPTLAAAAKSLSKGGLA